MSGLATQIASLEAAVSAGIDAPGSVDEAHELLSLSERIGRLAAVVRVDAVAAVDDSGRHYDHGHVSAVAMVRHVGKVSSADGARLEKIGRMLAMCDQLSEAWRAGELSVDQAAVLGRAFANPRTRDLFIDAQQWFIDLTDRPFKVFERRVADWARLADDDGPEPKPEPAHESRDAVLVQDHFSQQWLLRGSFGSLQGAKLRRIFDAYLETETLADWDAARDTHGPDACRDQLPRTTAQRRADAFEQIFADALHNPSKSTAIDTVHNIVWSEQSHEELLRRYAGADPAPIEIDTHRCHNLDGHTLHAGTAFADFLTAKWRRVVHDAQGVTVDMSKNQRFFTGLARLGVQLSFDSCYWPGCHIPVTQCQIDHLDAAARGGLTEQTNGAPACQTHNRKKERGYTVARLADGTIQITTPTGTVIPQ